MLGEFSQGDALPRGLVLHLGDVVVEDVLQEILPISISEELALSSRPLM